MLFSHPSDRLSDVPDALGRGFEGSGREHIWSAAEDDSCHYGSLSQTIVELIKGNVLNVQNWLRNHHVDIWWSIFIWNVCTAFFPHQIWAKRGNFQNHQLWSLDTWRVEQAGVFHESWTKMWLPRVTAGDGTTRTQKTRAFPIMHLGPVCAFYHVALRDQSKYDMKDDFHIRQRGQMCCDSQRKHAEKCDLQNEPTGRPTAILSMQVCLSNSVYLHFSFYGRSMQNFISFVYYSNLRILSDDV